MPWYRRELVGYGAAALLAGLVIGGLVTFALSDRNSDQLPERSSVAAAIAGDQAAATPTTTPKQAAKPKATPARRKRARRKPAATPRRAAAVRAAVRRGAARPTGKATPRGTERRTRTPGGEAGPRPRGPAIRAAPGRRQARAHDHRAAQAGQAPELDAGPAAAARACARRAGPRAVRDRAGAGREHTRADRCAAEAEAEADPARRRPRQRRRPFGPRRRLACAHAARAA